LLVALAGSSRSEFGRFVDHLTKSAGTADAGRAEMG
jgi:hypothetical protein